MASAGTGQIAVETRGLGKRYGRNWALRGLSIQIPAGQSVCLLGPNGSGKSTLLRILATSARPTTGQVMVFRADAVKDGDSVRARVGFLSHRTFLYGELTALENLQFAAGMYGLHEDVATLHRLLDDVGLGQATHHRVRGFSQGMSQRLSLARATLHSPSLLLLDEPYSALDQGGLAALDRYFQGFKDSGGTAIVVTHQVERGLAACERTIAIKSGQLVYDGPSSSFLSSPEAASIGDWA